MTTSGDHAGIHPHLWRWNPATRDWFNDFDDETWLQECLDTAIAGYTLAFERPPEACRFGDRWRSDAAERAMRARGIRYDLSSEPGRPTEPPPGDRRPVGRLPEHPHHAAHAVRIRRRGAREGNRRDGGPA